MENIVVQHVEAGNFWDDPLMWYVQVNESESKALLFVSYQSSDGGRVTPRIIPSLLLEQYVAHGWKRNLGF